VNEGLRVLITNDDGVAAPGLRWLAAAARDAGMRVVVAAPAQEASGTSAAMTAVVHQGRVITDARSYAQMDGLPVYGVTASPAYIVVLAALGVFGPPPDVVLSGINRGANAGQAVLHSGTVGAALTAAGHGIRALAASLDVLTPVDATAARGGAAVAEINEAEDESRHWATAAELVKRLLPALAEAPDGTVLNLNAPNLPMERVRGLRRAKLARYGQVQMAIAESGEGYVRTAITETDVEPEAGTDLALLAGGYATVTAVRTICAAHDVDLPAVDPDPVGAQESDPAAAVGAHS
jgi:5'-nucleotidase